MEEVNTKSSSRYSLYVTPQDGGMARIDTLENCAYITYASIDRKTSLCSAPLETGIKSQDHMVREPSTATVKMDVNNYVKEVGPLLDGYRRAGELFMLYTPDDFCDHLAISSIRSESDSQRPDITVISVSFEEQIFVQKEYTQNTKSADDSPTVKTGYTAPREA